MALVENAYSATHKIESKLPLSSAQKRMFIIDQQYSNIGMTYHNSGYMRIDGRLDAEKIQKALDIIIDRHEVLRASFHILDGELVQRIHKDIDFKLTYEDAFDVDIASIMSSFVKAFDLSKAPLIRAALVKKEENVHFLLLDLHHIVSDRISISILIRELIDIYTGKQLPALKLSYKDYTAGENQLIDSDKLQMQQKYWETVFSDGVPSLNLPLDYARPSVKCYEGERIDFNLGLELSKELNDFCCIYGVTLYTILTAAYHVLLSKYSGQEDIIIGTTTAGRRPPLTEGLIGMFVNTLPIRNQPNGNKAFTAFLQEVEETIRNSVRNQDYQFEQIVSRTGFNRDLSRNPLFDVMFEMQYIDLPGEGTNELKFNRFEYFGNGAKFDLLFEMANMNNNILLTIEYCTRLFKRETINRMAGQYINILKQVVLHPGILINDLEAITEFERRQICFEFNKTDRKYDTEKTVVNLFAERAEKNPDSIALVCNGAKVSYYKLNQMADKLADILIKKGIKQNNYVGIMVTRSVEMIAAMLGVLKSGAAYIPIDPDYPSTRVNYILDNSKTSLILINSSTISSCIDSGSEILDLSDIDFTENDEITLQTNSQGNDAAYVIYTSGSTGNPKGVIIEHKSVHNLIIGVSEAIDFTGVENILCLTTISFDIFVVETLLALAKGLAITIVDENQLRDPELLNKIIIENKIDFLQATPSRMQLLMIDENYRKALSSLKVILLGGEAVSEALIKEIKKYTSARIYNGYGPTEATVYSTIKDLTDTNEISIGKPISNTRAYITAKNGKLQPVGVPGELCISGDGVARGYLKKPDLNAEKFVLDPFNERMYKTGDLAKWCPNGEIEFLGRLDYQVKIRGYRIELDEVQAHLVKLSYIKDAVVIAREETNGFKYLCAYMISDEAVAPEEIRRSLRKVLPDYMVPTRYIQMDEFPTTPNGKIDRALLPKPDYNSMYDNESDQSQNEVQKKLIDIWSKVLQKDNIGVNDDFFKHGGDSLLAIKLKAEMANNNMNIEYSDLYKYRTVKEVSRYFKQL